MTLRIEQPESVTPELVDALGKLIPPTASTSAWGSSAATATPTGSLSA